MRSRTRGYTVVELMMALAVFATGVTGIVAMQRATVSSNRLAKNMTIATGVAQAYEHKYPKLREVCAEALPNLPRVFDDGTLHKVFNRHAKRLTGGEYREFKVC